MLQPPYILDIISLEPHWDPVLPKCFKGYLCWTCQVIWLRNPCYKNLSCIIVTFHIITFFGKDFYLLIFREEKGGRNRGRETSMCGCLFRAPHWGPGPQPRHVPWLGIEPATLWFTGQHSVHWATSARAMINILTHWFILALGTKFINIKPSTIGLECGLHV